MASDILNFDENFIYLRQIAKGGNSKVLLVKSKFDSKEYALKLFTIKKVDDLKEKIEEWSDELKPHMIVKTKEGGCFKYISCVKNSYMFLNYNNIVTPSILMEYLNGKDLFHYVENMRMNDEIADVTFIKTCTVEIFSALFILHSFNFVHRDIKGENFVFHNGALKLIDLGYASTMNSEDDNITSTGAFSADPPETYIHFLLEDKIDRYDDLRNFDDNKIDEIIDRDKSQFKRHYRFLYDYFQFNTSPSLDVYGAALIIWEIITGLERKKPFYPSSSFEKDMLEIYPREEKFCSLMSSCLHVDPRKRPSAENVLLKMGVTKEDLNYLLEHGEYSRKISNILRI